VVSPYASDFASDARVWLNTAHQGVLPERAAHAAREAIEWKQHPFELTTARFQGVPMALRRTFARVVGADQEDVVLANSASYGLHLVANGLTWRTGDEVLVMATDFPSDILPWLRLESRGVVVRQGRPRGRVFTPEEIDGLLGPKTRVLCLTWVHSFSGWAIDLHAIGALCRERGVLFVVNASQAIGARPLDVSAAPVDALVSVGFKWLCGPYGTGFCWLSPALRERLEPPKAYWLSMLTQDDLARPLDVKLKSGVGIRAFDVFGTANFFNFTALTASLELLLERGLEGIAAHDQALVTRFLERLDRSRWEVESPLDGPARSTLVVLRHRVAERTSAGAEALSHANVFAATRAGSLRIAPHLHNGLDDVELAAEVLNGV
jgi:selenocysteine lyase/cysteine desulfurase